MARFNANMRKGGRWMGNVTIGHLVLTPAEPLALTIECLHCAASDQGQLGPGSGLWDEGGGVIGVRRPIVAEIIYLLGITASL